MRREAGSTRSLAAWAPWRGALLSDLDQRQRVGGDLAGDAADWAKGGQHHLPCPQTRGCVVVALL